ncbi:BREX-1 system adenine-specific DNA-methyltransferase PglX [bacterium]|nr:BREX-1 system adenine-specific DNA-methyltransferase PglX [bacterium]
MNTRSLERFAQDARRRLHSQIAARLDRVLTTDSADLRANARTVEDLQRQVKQHGKQSVVERVAYTWFNRFCALRYMDVNRYTRTGVLSPAQGNTQPEILQEAKAGVIAADVEAYVDAQAVFDLLNGRTPSADAQTEAYRLLLVGACNAYHASMPFLFETIDHYTELLMPEDLLSQSSIVQAVRDALTADACTDVEVIGWLYQFYISEKKDQVIGSKAKIKAADIPAATQLFTPHWIVRYLVENSLGRLWMLNRPGSRLVERMEYYIAPETSGHEAGKDHHAYGHEVGQDRLTYGHEVGRAASSSQQDAISPPHLVPLPIASPEEIRLCDPAAGSGHMLTYAFDLLYAIYEEEGYQPSDIPRLILTKNLYGMEIDERAAALAAFALTMKARAKDRRFLSRSTRDSIKPNICVLHPIPLTEKEVKPEIDLLAEAVAAQYGHEVGQDHPAYGHEVGQDHPAYGHEVGQDHPAYGHEVGQDHPAYGHEVGQDHPAYGHEVGQDHPAYGHEVGQDHPAYGHEVGRAISSLQQDAISPPHLVPLLLHDLTLFPHADNFGSLLRPQLGADQIRAARTALDAAPAGQLDWTRQTVRDQMRQALDQAEYLARKYHVVVANPPYMGGGNANEELKNFAQKEYPDSKADLFAMFIERNLELAQHNGMVAMITMQSWMFLSSYEKLREKLLERDTILSMAHLGARAFDTIGGEVVSTTAFVLERAKHPTYKGAYLRLIDGNSEAEKAEMFRSSLATKNRPLKTDFYRAAAVDFKKIPGSPIAYWLGHFVIFDRPKVSSAFVSGGRLKTHDGTKYLRFTWEVSYNNIRWQRIVKGGEFRKYFGHEIFVADWSTDAIAFYEEKGGLPAKQYLQSEGLCWSKITSATTSFRIKSNYTEYDAASPTLFVLPDQEYEIEPVLAYLNSSVARHLLGGINPTINTQVGDVMALPLPAIDEIHPSIKQNTRVLINSTKSDWDAYETSWDFTDLPLLRAEFRGETLAATYAALRAHWRHNTLEMQRLETENNRIFIDAYGLQAELTPEVPLAEITLTCNPYYRYGGQSAVDSSQWEGLRRQSSVVCRQLEAIADELAAHAGVDVTPSQRLGLEQRLLADTVREFISYAVGCLFGRYSLDKPGLILANQGVGARGGAGRSHPVARNAPSAPPHAPTLMPDNDNVIPVLDGDWFADDISERFKHFLRVTFGEDHYSDNLRFVEEALGRDVRSYFLRDFYDDHVRRYQKRPIYWLFSSAKGSFNALVYMHRYRPHTVSVVLNDYLRELRAKLNARKRHLEAVSISAGAAARDKTAALKEIDKIDKVLAELQEYEDDVLYPLATRQVEIDLDDGVKVNYNKLGGALKKITGLSG